MYNGLLVLAVLLGVLPPSDHTHRLARSVFLPLTFTLLVCFSLVARGHLDFLGGPGFVFVRVLEAYPRWGKRGLSKLMG